ncbi:MAG: ATP synthase subunit I [Gammaproteobacteria bacterium]
MLKSVVLRLIAWQLGVGIAAALLWLLVSGEKAALAALAGGAIGAVLSLYFAAQFLFRSRGREPGRVISTLYRAEALKLLLAVGLFSAAAVLFAREFLAVMTTFAASLSGYWLALIWTADEK